MPLRQSAADRAIALLGDGRRPRTGIVVGHAPGRVNLIGEHTDYSGGLVLPIAIDRLTAVAVTKASDPTQTRVVTADLGEAPSGGEVSSSSQAPSGRASSSAIGGNRTSAAGARRSDITTGWLDLRAPLTPPVSADAPSAPGTESAPAPPSGASASSRAPPSTPFTRGDWLSYIAGVLAAFQRHHGLRHNLDIAIASDVSVGSGLSSSAALESALVVAVERFLGASLSPAARARMGRQAEHEFAGVPCGIMDQFASVMGVAGHALLIDCQSERVEHVPLPPPERARIVVMNTNVRHALSGAGGEYAARRAACERAAQILGVSTLRDATPELIAGGAAAWARDDDARRAADHVVSENARVLAAVAALRLDDLAEFGRQMLESHHSLRDVYRVSCPELDTIVEAAMAVPGGGVHGARMTGGGFGGCAIAICDPSVVETLHTQVADAYRARHARDATIFEVTAGPGAFATE